MGLHCGPVTGGIVGVNLPRCALPRSHYIASTSIVIPLALVFFNSDADANICLRIGQVPLVRRHGELGCADGASWGWRRGLSCMHRTGQEKKKKKKKNADGAWSIFPKTARVCQRVLLMLMYYCIRDLLIVYSVSTNFSGNPIAARPHPAVPRGLRAGVQLTLGLFCIYRDLAEI